MKLEELQKMIDTIDCAHCDIWLDVYDIVRAIGDICYRDDNLEFAPYLICSFVRKIDCPTYDEGGIDRITHITEQIHHYLCSLSDDRCISRFFSNRDLSGPAIRYVLSKQLRNHLLNYVIKLENWSKMGG
jgi:hypothetical protein